MPRVVKGERGKPAAVACRRRLRRFESGEVLQQSASGGTDDTWGVSDAPFAFTQASAENFARYRQAKAAVAEFNAHVSVWRWERIVDPAKAGLIPVMGANSGFRFDDEICDNDTGW